MVSIRRSLWVASVALSIAACNALIGIEDPIVVAPQAGSCLLNSDCPDPGQVCLFQVCSPPCQVDRDCADGGRCLATKDGKACVAEDVGSCSTEASCPEGSVCASGACRNACDAGCLGEQECGDDGACYPAENLGNGGGSSLGGAGGSNAGAPDSGGAGGASEPSEARCSPGSKRCAELVIETCIEDEWTQTGDCPFACEQGACSGECTPETEDCSGLVPRTCSEDANWVSGVACAKVCDKGACVDKCEPGALQCSNGDLLRCGSDGTYQPEQDCAVDCVNERCTECTPPDEECKGGAHRSCGQDGKWGTSFTCPFMCVGKDCGVCSPNPTPTECIGNTPQFCDETGQFQPARGACSGAAPLCENGECVACAAGALDCLDGNTPRACQDGQWQNQADCSGSKPACLRGACVACAPTTLDCLDSNTPRTCQSNGTWKNGTDCSGRTPVCLAGSCAECTPNATPTHCASACTKTRQYCTTQGLWANFASSCTGSDSCSAGTCSLAPESQAGQYTALPSWVDGVADNLLANRIQITCRSDLLRLGARFRTAAGRVRFALYDDNAGEPGRIVAGTASTNVVVGLTEVGASGAVLAPGYYWVVMNIESQSAAVHYEDGKSPAPTRYASYAFGTASFPPTSFPAPSTLPHLYNSYVVVRANP